MNCDAYPQLQVDCKKLLRDVVSQRCTVSRGSNPTYNVVVEYPKEGALYPGPLFDAGCILVRSVQEQPLLSTKVNNRPTFLEVWNTNEDFRSALLSHKDPTNFGKWALRKVFGYTIASTFVPCLASGIYTELQRMVFGETEKQKQGVRLKVLDPCAGWGDRLLGAFASGVVEEYTGVDPNSALFSGYQKLIDLFSEESRQEPTMATMRATMIQQPFEKCDSILKKDYFDVVFTSPPFWDYEIYCDLNPKYTDWEREFYEPLVQLCISAVKPNGFVVFHIDDTTAGQVPRIIKECSTCRLGVDIGFGKRIVSVWILQKGLDGKLVKPQSIPESTCVQQRTRPAAAVETAKYAWLLRRGRNHQHTEDLKQQRSPMDERCVKRRLEDADSPRSPST